MTAFESLGLSEDLLKGIEALGFSTPTPVQEMAIPVLLREQGDVVALAQTGTGKTAAFGLPLIQHIDPTVRAVQGLILCPTRELCVQVASDLVNYSKFGKNCKVTAVYGGASIENQIRDIRSGTNIVVATPGRLIDLIRRGAIKLEQVQRLVLDEADEMLNMGFKDDIDVILGSATGVKSTWLFSATMPAEVRAIAKNYMTNPVELQTGIKNQANVNIEHVYYVCRPDDRYAALKRIVDNNPGIFGLIFCRTKADTKEIADAMNQDGYNSDALHGDLSQNDRDRVMKRFRDGTLQLLIATDVAARGIDVQDISHVIHYGLPDDIEVYTHRSGRTGRAGKKGISMSIVTPKHAEKIWQIERMIKAEFKKLLIPTGAEICEKQLFNIVQTIHDSDVQEEQIAPFLPKIYEAFADLSKEELIKRFASIEFNSFLDYYKNAQDLNVRKRDDSRPSRDGGNTRQSLNDGQSPFKRNNSDSRFARLFANIGDMDGVTKKDFAELLNKTFDVPNGSIGNIDIKKSFMHFDVERSHADVVKAGLKRMQVNGRNVRVDEADGGNTSRSGGGGFSGGGKPPRREFANKRKDRSYA
jgi:ATP-dependent RNA helicase DeaD